MTKLAFLPCLDSSALAAARERELGISRDAAASLGRSAVTIAREGAYQAPSGRRVDIRDDVAAAMRERRSLPPEAELPAVPPGLAPEMRVQVTNESTMGAGRRLVEDGLRSAALNFANGVHPGGGFLRGARAQEEALCRSSALYVTLERDPMYRAHAEREDRASSDWVILSPGVPFFRTDDGTALETAWLLGVLTCAAPVASREGQPRSGDLLRTRIHRVLAVARAYRYEALVLGAWGCGAFRNDPARTAADFRDALAGPYRGAFREVVFAIADWSPERRFLGPFRDLFAPGREPSA